MLRVLIADPLDPICAAKLRAAGLEVDERPDLQAGELLRVVGDYDVVIVRGRTKITREVLEHASRLRVVGRAGVGLDNIDLEAARQRGVRVVNTPEASTRSVAELVLGLMITLSRQIAWADRELKRGGWPKKVLMGEELEGKVLGVIGLGRIGRAVTRLARCLGMLTLGYDIVELPSSVVEELGVKLVGLEELLRVSDYISLHVPATPQTYHLIDEARLRVMKPTARLINTSRGSVVDEQALYRALKEGWIAGAALDVFEVEPPINRELLGLPNVVATPHIGGQTREAQRRAAELIVERVLEALSAP